MYKGRGMWYMINYTMCGMCKYSYTKILIYAIPK